MSGNLVRQVSDLKFEPTPATFVETNPTGGSSPEVIVDTPEVVSTTPEESHLPTAYIFVNDDCTGDSYSIDLEEGELFAETEFWTILGDGWDNKGASVMVPSDYTLTLW